MMRGASNLGREGTTREERHEATRWWLLQHLGIMSVDEETPQEVEYVLRTKLFNAEKEKARREQLRLTKNMETTEDNVEDNINPATPTKRTAVKGDEEMPDTPETVATSFNGSDDDQSPIAVPNDTCLDEDDDTFECTICLTEVEEGDRVGILSCQHIFHAECLQQWISRRNVCPLCQDPDIASPRPVENSGSNSSLQTEESEVLGNQVTSNEESEGSNDNSDNTSAETSTEDTTPWYRPTFLFPISISNEQREAPGLSIEMSENERVSSRRGSRQQRRRRRHHQSDEFGSI